MKKVYIHGLGQTSESWDMVFTHLGNNGNNVCPNLAELVQGKEVTYNTLYAAFAMVCNAIEEPISLCSLSLGSVLALNYAIEYPEKVKSLVLIAAQYKMLILSILVDTFISKISLPMQPVPEIGSISGA